MPLQREQSDSPDDVTEEAELEESVQDPNLLVLGHDVFGRFIVEQLHGAAPQGGAGHDRGLREREGERETTDLFLFVLITRRKNVVCVLLS